MNSPPSPVPPPAPRPAAPVAGADRIASLDVLRGFAVLGILIVNMASYARVSSAYMNPTSGGAFAGLDVWIWAFIELFADTKFISIFSVLFGAGIAMVADRAAQRGQPAPTRLHYRRHLVLLAFGLAHAYLVWYGDILVAYALCGFFLYPLRNLPARALLRIGWCAVAFVVALWGWAALSLPYWPEADRVAAIAEWAPPDSVLAAETAGFRGGFLDQLRVRAPIAFTVQTTGLAGMVFWRAGGLMLVGMALYRMGVLSAKRSNAFYRRMATLGIAAGLPLIAAGIAYKLHHDFAFEHAMFQGALFNYVGSIGMFLAYVALVMLAVRSNRLPGLQRRLAATGRMALTNYLTQSLVCTFVFYGHGLGLFERVPPVGQVGIVAAIWALQLAWSPWWLNRFRFGPLEWLWRTASYGKRQPMRRQRGRRHVPA